jgi:hypothetical protein
VALTVSGTIIWFSGGNQGLGYAIFMTGGVMWLILQNAEKKRVSNQKAAAPDTETPRKSSPRSPKPRRQSDFTD